MLQYAIPKAPESFQRQSPYFADSPRAGTTTTAIHPDLRSSSSAGPTQPNEPQQQQHPLHHHRPPALDPASLNEIHLPALSALASIAANAPAAVMNPPASNSADSTRSSTPTTQSSNNMTSTQLAPAATPGGTTQNSPPVCANCSTSTTPLWRRDESGSVLCNACGLFLKLHGRPRPISLKTDVIKSRNRVKASQTKKRDSQGGHEGVVHAQNGYAAAHPDVAHSQAHHAHVPSLPMGIGGDQLRASPPRATASRSNTPALSHQNSGLSNQHIYDAVPLPSDAFASASLPSFAPRHPSPAPAPLNGHLHSTSSHPESAQNHDSLVNQNNTLRTRVSELEVINDLFRGRVGELEASEHEARQQERRKDEELERLALSEHNALQNLLLRDNEIRRLETEVSRLHSQSDGRETNEGEAVSRLTKELTAANSRVRELEKRLAEPESEGRPARKKSRIDEEVVFEESDGVAGTFAKVGSGEGAGAASAPPLAT